MTQQSSLSKPVENKLHRDCLHCLQQVGEAALENVSRDREGRLLLTPEGQPNPHSGAPYGGPFSAGVCLLLPDGTVEMIGEPKNNTVLGKGVASFHAEHEILSGYPYAELVNRLNELRAEGKEGPTVLLLSSAQSCPTCQTKQEIIARELVRHELIAPGHFISLYGASFDDTLKVAGFNDKIYAAALIMTAEHPDAPGSMLRHRTVALADLQESTKRLFMESRWPVAIVEREGALYATGSDARSDTDLFSTAEVVALRNAGLRYQQEGHDDPWGVDGTLYTTTLESGPLCLTEANWTRIAEIVHVVLPPELQDKQHQTRESASIDNKAFLSIIAGGYKAPSRAVNVYRDPAYRDKAQLFWSKLLHVGKAKLYNGASGTEAVQTFLPLAEERFSAPDFATFK